jgi:hypothetical protein
MSAEVLPEQSISEKDVGERTDLFGLRITIGKPFDVGQQTLIRCSRGSDGQGKGIFGSWLECTDFAPGEGSLIIYFRKEVRPVLDVVIEEKIKPLLGL